ncbi:DUF2544 domain-containing protein [Escherichia marmotae]|uniref:DUF2544 domain-containing protein n=2 Tax=Escherichia marmotae TaxID=1499973 RepID=A0A7L5XC38_9ESCH|nr:DUF2544 domain-containing protein [Escherichia marmotae]
MKKKYSLIIFVLLSLFFSTNSMAKPKLHATFNTQRMYYAISKTSLMTLTIAIVTPEGAFSGTITGYFRKDRAFPVSGWTGDPGTPPAIPTVTVTAFDNTGIPDSYCPNLPGGWDCAWFELRIDTGGEDYGCPWISEAYATTTNDDGTYQGPTARGTVCPTVPVDSYDISWSKDYVQHDKTLVLKSTGATIHTVLPTYLMEGGQWCDGSKQGDGRGEYCRYVGQMTSLTSQGCSNIDGGASNVTATVVASPAFESTLSQITLDINTAGGGQFTTECYFQYLMEEL